MLYTRSDTPWAVGPANSCGTTMGSCGTGVHPCATRTDSWCTDSVSCGVGIGFCFSQLIDSRATRVDSCCRRNRWFSRPNLFLWHKNGFLWDRNPSLCYTNRFLGYRYRFLWRRNRICFLQFIDSCATRIDSCCRRNRCFSRLNLFLWHKHRFLRHVDYLHGKSGLRKPSLPPSAPTSSLSIPRPACPRHVGLSRFLSTPAKRWPPQNRKIYFSPYLFGMSCQNRNFRGPPTQRIFVALVESSRNPHLANFITLAFSCKKVSAQVRKNLMFSSNFSKDEPWDLLKS